MALVRAGGALAVVGWVIAFVPIAGAEMQRLDESALAEISGQSGISVEVELGMTADRISYLDDGKAVQLEGFRVGSAEDPEGRAYHLIMVDIGDDAALNLDYLIEDRRIEFGDVRLAGAPGLSMGGVFFDHNLQGEFSLRSDGAHGGGGYTFDSAYTMTGGRLGYRTNGNEVFLDGITMNVEALGVTLDVVDDVLQLRAPRVVGSWEVGAVRFSGNPLNHGVSTDSGTGTLLSSYGGFAGHYDLTSATDIQAGGRNGQGLRIDSQTEIHSASFLYKDDGNVLALRDMTGHYGINDLRFDVTTDWQGRESLGLTLGALEGELFIGGIEMGAAGKSLGQVNARFVVGDSVFNNERYGNAVYLQGGGNADAGAQGLRLATEWSLKSADLSYSEDGNRVIFSGLQSWGRGDMTVDVTREEVRNGTQFYDGLRIGFEGIRAGYRLNGLRIGSDDAQLQGGTELLLALGIYPAYEFELDGQLTLGPGGAQGEGITVNSDIRISNGRAAIIAAPYDEGNGEISQQGLWISELDYDGHLRGMTVDVNGEGLSIVKGEAWSSMDVGNLRVGDKLSGASFGRFVLQKYERDSSMLLSPGGAGTVCAGGVGASELACESTGGIWEERGGEGMTVTIKQILARAVSDDKKNAFVWETGRKLDANGVPANGTGTRLVLNDIYTGDGVDADGNGLNDNSFGIQTDLAIDVYQTRVVKKESGADSQGVIGNRGDEKIMDPSAPAGYRYVPDPGETELVNRPLGFAVQAKSRFKELSINNIDLVHPSGGAETLVYGVKMQNFDIRANLTATPIP